MITLATVFTLIRIACAPVVVFYILDHQWVIALLMFIGAMATDLIDGFIARCFRQQSRLGQLLDPVADKILILSSLGAMLYTFSVLPWQQNIIIFLMIKEVLLLLGGAFLIMKYHYFVMPSFLSRLTSLTECVLIMIMFISVMIQNLVVKQLVIVLLSMNVVLSLWLLGRYGLKLIKICKSDYSCK